MTRVAVFGGSFNPPHVSHVLAACYVLATQPVDRVLVVPAFSHPFGKNLLPFEHRVAMCELAFADLARVQVSTLEQSLGQDSRTLFMLQALQKAHPHDTLRLIVGSDILLEAHKWFAWDQVIALAPLIVLGREGHPAPGAPAPVLPELASRDLRARLARGEDVADLLPRAVREYISTHGLYRE
ncbi:MAG: nicotinate (nicotinamide) nucleotide adenylyltransferase [Deltaproteobacteria bacterium]|nr:nicotinate (nicotinamide) nucleotide adenylyltransferase [Deltaproteobacteria bacterium]